jgi:Leucine-rich repeat (LRR) protein
MKRRKPKEQKAKKQRNKKAKKKKKAKKQKKTKDEDGHKRKKKTEARNPKKMDAVPDDLVVHVARLLVRACGADGAAYGLGSASRRMRALVKIALASEPNVWLRVSGSASAAACISSFRDAPSVSVEAQVTARSLEAALSLKRKTRLANLCVGAVIARSKREALGLMRTLARLDLVSLDITMSLTNGIGMLSSLERLVLFASDCPDLRCVARLTRLRDLELTSCHALVDIRHVSSLSSLTRIAFAYCSRLRDVAPLATVASLTDVGVSAVSARTANIASALTSLGSLRVLRVRRATLAIETVARLTGLETLFIQRTVPRDDAAVGTLSALHRLSTLEYDGDGCDGYRVVPIGLDRLRQLSVLRLIRCDLPSVGPSLAGLSSVGLAGLQFLVELHCSEVNVAVLDAPTTLTSLSLHRCHELTDAGFSAVLASLVALRTLKVSSCAGLRDLSSITRLTSLERVDVSCDVPRDLASFSRLTNLRSLAVHVPSGVRGVASLASLSRLADLRVGSFTAERDEDQALALVDAAPNIRTLFLNGCSARLCAAVERRPDLRARVRAYLL